MSTVSLTLSLTAPDAATAQQYLAALMAAFADAYPELLPNPQTGQPDPNGVMARQLLAHILDVYAAYRRKLAVQAVDQQVQHDLQTALQSVTYTASLTSADAPPRVVATLGRPLAEVPDAALPAADPTPEP